jgi:hypothetical protein
MKSIKAPRIPKAPTITNKRCPSGMFCVDRLLFVFFLLVIAFLIYLYHVHIANLASSQKTNPTFGVDPSIFLIPKPAASMEVVTQQTPIIGLSTRYDVLRDPYVPPVKVDGYLFDSRSSDIRGLPPLVAPIQTSPPLLAPVNVETRGVNNQYSQVGILTKEDKFSKTDNSRMPCTKCDQDDGMNSNIENRLILPLMGRRHLTGRDKWQYYSISNTGNLNTKLPIRSNGRSCTSEYGCDQLMNGDTVYVEGYNHAFKATIYENSVFSYLPVL